MPLKLPPLNALRAFEVAARTGSFVLAGEELNVSSAAISQHIKNLEAHLGKTLFYRRGNRIALTDAGEVLYPEVASGFATISDRVDLLLAAPKAPQLVVSVLPVLAVNWFLSRLARFREQYPASIMIRVDDDPVDLIQENIDLRLTYSTTLYDEFQEFRLFSDEAVAVCAPGVGEGKGMDAGDFSTLDAGNFIHNHWGQTYGSAPQWQDWFKTNGIIRNLDGNSGIYVSDMAVAIELAKHGEGFALVPQNLIASQLEKGALIKPPQMPLKARKHYVALVPHAKADKRIAQDFLQHILEVIDSASIQIP